ncbi:unnamed protein product [Cuscuta epithymum]|uniref:Jacalin-type lectin domain-containing protein n=1 Tax=Cuscuta epithymum TaxID=186058 RepID=A0AAV0DBZ8_9ASTE|nr:unnamed protein product [Cuscuta epithymum]
MQLSTEMAIAAVDEALSMLNDELNQYCPCAVDDLLIELTWLKGFLADGQQTTAGRKRADIWSPIIQRLALCAVNLQPAGGWIPPGLEPLAVKGLTQKLSKLREKLCPFHSSPVEADLSSFLPNVPDSPPSSAKSVKLSAWGGPGGTVWDYKFDGALKQITIVNGEVVESLSFITLKPDGLLKTLKVGGCGPRGAYKTSEVNINGTSERLIGISGTHGFFSPNVVIKSIAFRTNLNVYGPYGSNDGAPFEYVVEKGGKIVGLHGRCGWLVDSIGVHYCP